MTADGYTMSFHDVNIATNEFFLKLFDISYWTYFLKLFDIELQTQRQ